MDRRRRPPIIVVTYHTEAKTTGRSGERPPHRKQRPTTRKIEQALSQLCVSCLFVICTNRAWSEDDARRSILEALEDAQGHG